MDEAHLRRELAAVNNMLHACWLDAIWLEAGRESWRRLSPKLGTYHNAYPLLWGWYRDATLAGCRRLLDDRNDPDLVSVVRALRRLQRVAPHVTVELLVQLRAERSPDMRREHLERDAREAVAAAVSGDRHGDASRLTKGSVQRDLGRLRRVHADVLEYASSTVGHRISCTPPVVGEPHLSALLDDVLDVAGRWVGVVDGVHLDTHPLHVTGVEAMARGLELFDWREYVEAVSDEQYRRLDPGAPREAFDAIESATRVRYVWPEAGE